MTGPGVDLPGSLASAPVPATFCTRGMVPLRGVAITSNLAFIVYAVRAGLHPLLLLLPTDIYRPAQ